MHVCFIDEAGDLGTLSDPPLPNDQPVLVIGGLFVDVASLASLTDNFLSLKHQYFPGLPYPSTRPLDRILPEIKGSEIRGNATRGTARQRTHAIGFLDRILGLLRHQDVKLVARIWVKGIGLPFAATAVYTSSIQGICAYFDQYLTQTNDTGMCIADSRNKFKNVSVSHSIFTQKHSPEHGTQPAGWTRTHGTGRVCVLTPGHNLAIWQHPSYQRLLRNCLAWCAGETDTGDST